MKDRKLTDQELETLAKAIVTAGNSASNVEGVLSDPKLYHSILAKIAAECDERTRPSRFAWRPIAALASLVVLISVSLSVYFGSGSEARRANILTVPDTINDIKPRPFIPSPAQRAESVEGPVVVNTAVKKVAEKRQAVKPRRIKQQAARDPEPVFHPIGFAERAEDAAIDGRVVRVEMPRSALFALGVNIPLENSARSVKADLLVGADGSPRAIRLVE